MRGKRRENSKKNDRYYQDILNILSKNAKPLDIDYILKKIQVKNYKQKEEALFFLNKLIIEKKIKETSKGHYEIAGERLILEGILDATIKGGAYFVNDSMEEDIFIKEDKINTGLHGDTVKCVIFKGNNGRNYAEVIEIVKRNKTSFVGTVKIKKGDNFAFVIPDNRRINVDFFIPKERINGLKDGLKVVVKLKDWPLKLKNPYGEILEILGNSGEHETEIHSILAEYNLPYKFTVDVEKEAKKLSIEIDKEEISKRKDFRNITTFTIDPFDAKDFDDALSFEDLNNGKYRVGIHIADVSHYVKPNTKLDKEAIERGTSVYLVDRVVPMLPEILSNNVCSLKPNEEKLTFSVVIDIDDDGNIHKRWIGKTIINSNKRFTYEEAQSIIEKNEGELKDIILKLDTIAKKLRSDRIKKGAISFEGEEVKFKLDKENNPIEVYFKISKDSNHLIEEFMLLANKIVSEEIGDKPNPKTFVYRIHDKPDKLKLDELSSLAKKLGYKTIIGKSNNDISKDINQLLKEAEGNKDANMIQTLAVRSMSKAKYSTDNIGHYGLNFKFYSHFTSPIRRYPDIIAHRLLEKYLIENGKSENRETIEKLCEYSSSREKLAVEAERESIKYMQAKYMEKMIGKEFKGIISGMNDFGFFVEVIENKCEGFISIRDSKDKMEINKKEYTIKINNENIKLGDTISIIVKSVNIFEKQINFNFIKPI